MEGKIVMGFFDKLKSGLEKTRKSISEKIDGVLGAFTKIDEDLFSELEEVLITADIGVNTTMEIIEKLRCEVKQKRITEPYLVKETLKSIIEDILKEGSGQIDTSKKPLVLVVIGVNGVGKTTTIAKIANLYKKQGKKVVIAAADTFRAAAIDQLDLWANRVGVDIIKHSEGSDPGAVVFDAVKAVNARNMDVLICDTAGRLHTKKNLMEELKKIYRIIQKGLSDADCKTLLVLDATTGQNAISQAKTFKEAVGIDGLALTKLDGTAKGGIVIAIHKELDIPVCLIGVGEGIDDLQQFDAKEFARALF